jgi:soluble lytic murein transglycosylase-like protein
MQVKRPYILIACACLSAAPAAIAASKDSGPGGADELMASPLAEHPLESPLAKRASIRAQREAAQARRRLARRREARRAAAVPPVLRAIAACESGGNPRAVSSTGAYRGKYQFSRETWQAVGGSGDPAAAPEGEQDRRAAILLTRSGPGQWPVCAG